MASRRKSRADNIDDIEDRIAQWNVATCNRTLEKLFEENKSVVRSKIKKKKYTPEELFNKAYDYFQDIIFQNQNGFPIIPDVEDFCLHCNISRQEYFNYQHSDNEDMQNVAMNIANAIANAKKTLALQGLIDFRVMAYDFNNNHGYASNSTLNIAYSSPESMNLEGQEILQRLPDNDM